MPPNKAVDSKRLLLLLSSTAKARRKYTGFHTQTFIFARLPYPILYLQKLCKKLSNCTPFFLCKGTTPCKVKKDQGVASLHKIKKFAHFVDTLYFYGSATCEVVARKVQHECGWWRRESWYIPDLDIRLFKDTLSPMASFA